MTNTTLSSSISFIQNELHSFAHETSGTTVDGFCFTCASWYVVDRRQLGLRRIRVAEQMYQKLQILALRHCITESMQCAIWESCIQVCLQDSCATREQKQEEKVVEILLDCQSIFLEVNPYLLHDYVSRVYQGMIDTSWSRSKLWLSMLCTWFNVPTVSKEFVVQDTINNWNQLINHILTGLHFPDEEVKTSILYILLKMVQFVEDEDYLYQLFNSSVLNKDNLSVINMVFQNLIRSETIDFQQNTVALLNLITQKSCFMQLQLNMQTVCDGLICVVLSDLEPIQVFVIQIISRLCTAGHTQHILRSDIPDFVFEALKSDSPDVISSILSLFEIIIASDSCSADTLGSFLLGFLQYGVDVVITAIQTITDEHLRVQYIHILYKIIEKVHCLSEEEEGGMQIVWDMKQNLDTHLGRIISVANTTIAKRIEEGTYITLDLITIVLKYSQDLSESVHELEAIVRCSTDIIKDIIKGNFTDCQHHSIMISYLRLIDHLCKRNSMVSPTIIQEVCQFTLNSIFPMVIDSDETIVLERLYSLLTHMFAFDKQLIELGMIDNRLLSKTLNILQWCEESDMKQQVMKVLSIILDRYSPTPYELELNIAHQLQVINWSEGASITDFASTSSQQEIFVTLAYLLFSFEKHIPDIWIPNFQTAMKHYADCFPGASYPIIYLCYLTIAVGSVATVFEMEWILKQTCFIINSRRELSCLPDKHWNTVFEWILTQDINYVLQWFESLLSNTDNIHWITCRLKDTLNATCSNLSQLLVTTIGKCSNQSENVSPVLDVINECCKCSRELSSNVVSLGLHSLLHSLLTTEVLVADNSLSHTYRKIILTLTITSPFIEDNTCPIYPICRLLLKSISKHGKEISELLPSLNLFSILLYQAQRQQMENFSQIRLMFSDSIHSDMVSQLISGFICNKDYVRQSGTIISLLQFLRILSQVHVHSLRTIELKLSTIQQIIQQDSPFPRIMAILLVSDLIRSEPCILRYETGEMMDFIYTLQSILATAEEKVRLAVVKCLKDLSQIEDEFKELIVHECWNSMIGNVLVDEAEISGVIQVSLLDYLDLMTKETKGFELEHSSWVHQSNMGKISFIQQLVSHSLHSVNERDLNSAEKCIKILSRIRFGGTLQDYPDLIRQLNEVEALIQEIRLEQQKRWTHDKEIVDDLVLFSNQVTKTMIPGLILLPAPDGEDTHQITVIESLLNE